MNDDRITMDGDGDSDHNVMRTLDFGLDSGNKPVYEVATWPIESELQSQMTFFDRSQCSNVNTSAEASGIILDDVNLPVELAESYHAYETQTDLENGKVVKASASIIDLEGVVDESTHQHNFIYAESQRGGTDIFFLQNEAKETPERMMSEITKLNRNEEDVAKKEKATELKDLIDTLGRTFLSQNMSGYPPPRPVDVVQPVVKLLHTKRTHELIAPSHRNPAEEGMHMAGIGWGTSSKLDYHIDPFNELLDSHRTPYCYEVDYAEHLLDDEIAYLKREAGMTDVAVKLETQYSVLQKTSLKHCPVCGNGSTLTCKNCLNVAYCTREHQKTHWKQHRVHCVLFEMVENNLLGRHLVAKTNIKPGELILKECPLLVGPTAGDSFVVNFKFDVSVVLEKDEVDSVKTGLATMDDISNDNDCNNLFNPVCLGCSLDLSVEDLSNAYVCENCGWPLCSKDCFEIQNHKMECLFFQEQNISFLDCFSHYLLPPRIYVVLRFLLIKATKPRVWNKLMNLQSHLKERQDFERVHGRRVNDLYIAFLIKKAFKFSKVTLEEIQMILGIMDTNGFYTARSSNLENEGVKTRRHISLYEKGSLLSHSCVANAIAIRLDPAGLEVVAAVAIKKGDVISIDYDYQGLLRPRYERHQFFNLQYFFTCSCSLCSDPTESGLYLSGICCLRCRRRGNEACMVPSDPLSEDPKWKCRKCSSQKSKAGSDKIITDVSTQMYESFNGIVPLRYVVQKFSGVILHKNHCKILSAELEIIRILYTHMTENMETLVIPDLEYLSDLIEKHVGIVQVFVPPCHKVLINLKLQLVEVMVVQACRISQTEEAQAVVMPISRKMQAIHDDIVALLTEHGLKNYLQSFLLFSARVVRQKLRQVHELLHRRKFFINKSLC